MNQLQKRAEILFGLKHYKLIVTAIHNNIIKKYILHIYSVLLIRHVKFNGETIFRHFHPYFTKLHILHVPLLKGHLYQPITRNKAEIRLEISCQLSAG